MISSYDHLTEGILLPINNKRRNNFHFSWMHLIYFYILQNIEYRLILLKFEFLLNIKEIEIFYIQPKPAKLK